MLNEQTLSANLLQLFESMHGDEPMSEKDYADALAKIITDHIKTANVQPGISVASAGTVIGMTSTPGSLI